MSSTRATRPCGLLSALAAGIHDTDWQLWIVFNRSDRRLFSARLAYRHPATNAIEWVGNTFDIPSDNFLHVSGLRDSTQTAVRLDNCSVEELDGLFTDVTVPFALWNAPC